MHGVDPKDYYRENPIENKVETKTQTHMAQFMKGHSHLSNRDVYALNAALRSISPMAVESVQVQMHRSQIRNVSRKNSITKLIFRAGYDKHLIMFEPSDVLGRDEVRLDVSYASVITPRCPDWRTSPVTTYSNTSQAGHGCATTNNLGMMVADPRDLERGSGHMNPDAARNSNVLESYRTNEGAGEEAAVSAEVNTSTAGQQ